VQSGQPLEAVLRGLGDPAALAASFLAAVPLVPAPLWRRGVAKLIDLGLVVVLVVPIVVAALLSRRAELFPFVVLFAVLGSVLLFCLHMVIGEWLIGQTIGKHLVAIAVVRENGARIGAGQAIVRQLPVLFQFYWIDVLFALFTDKRQRAFELLSKTRVVLAPVE
jgi:uncharacterized RDD family membrane protein YckC